jgi:hypothetical protein
MDRTNYNVHTAKRRNPSDEGNSICVIGTVDLVLSSLYAGHDGEAEGVARYPPCQSLEG